MKVIEDLDVYKLSFQLVLDIYKITGSFPENEKFGLISQMRRAAVSIVSNLSEGGARNTIGEQNHFIENSRGSAAELKTQVLLSRELNFLPTEKANDTIKTIDRIKMMLNGLSKSV